jgi:cobalt-zinc-cadmium efflux system outer membrane protein
VSVHFMKRNTFLSLCVFCSGVLGQAAASGQEMSIDALVQEALAKNPEASFYQAEIAAAKGDHRTAGTYPNPELSNELGYKRVSGGGLSAEGVAWSVALMQPFEYPGRIALRKAIANRQIELAELGYAQFRGALAARVRTLGHALLVAQEKAAAAEQVSNRGQELVEVLVQRDPAGVTPLLEMRIIEASVIVAKKRAADAAKEAQLALYELNQLRGVNLSTSLRVARADIKFQPLQPVDELAAIARTNNFEVLSRQVELAQQGLQVDLSKHERKPTITAGPTYSQEGGDETERIIGVGVSVPLPLWNRNEGNIEAAKARQQQAETSVLLAQRDVERQLRERYAIYDSLLKQMSFWRPESLQQLREAAELGDRHYRLGALPISTYTELQDKYLEAIEVILDTQNEALESREEINRLTGFAASQKEGK